MARVPDDDAWRPNPPADQSTFASSASVSQKAAGSEDLESNVPSRDAAAGISIWCGFTARQTCVLLLLLAVVLGAGLGAGFGIAKSRLDSAPSSQPLPQPPPETPGSLVAGNALPPGAATSDPPRDGFASVPGSGPGPDSPPSPPHRNGTVLEGQPCTADLQCAAPADTCLRLFNYTQTLNSTGTCTVLVSDGDDCRTDAQCWSQSCSYEQIGTTLNYFCLRTNGQPCSSPVQCASELCSDGYCTPRSE